MTITRVRRKRRRLTPSRLPYGHEHQVTAKAMVESYADGTARCPYADCPYPGRWMWRSQGLDAGHVVSRMLGGGAGPKRLEHAHCNRSHGATMGNAARKKRAQVAGMKAAATAALRKAKW
jgi:hypothetical protein